MFLCYNFFVSTLLFIFITLISNLTNRLEILKIVSLSFNYIKNRQVKPILIHLFPMKLDSNNKKNKVK